MNAETSKPKKPRRKRKVKYPMLFGLTPKELEVLTCCNGYKCYADIAEAMDISVNTVKTHMKHIMKKFDVKSRTQLLAKAELTGVLQVCLQRNLLQNRGFPLEKLANQILLYYK